VNVLLVPAHPGFPGQIPQSRKTVVVVVVVCICGGVMFGERLWKKTDRHVNWTGRMPWIMVDGASGQEMTDDHDGCV